MDYGRSTLADALAAQYVAGTLRGRARARFEALLPAHPALRDAVARWQARLLPLTAPIAPVVPPPRVWAGIERRLWPDAAAARAPWWQRLGPWRALTGGATAAALALAVLVATPPATAPDPLPPVVVVLQGTGAAAGPEGALAGTIVASLSGDGRALVTRPLTPVALTPERVLELWSVPPGGGAPRSLGLISGSGVTVLAREKLPATLLRGGTAALAVSVEPPGGSPTGAPTGPVVFAGEVRL